MKNWSFYFITLFVIGVVTEGKAANKEIIKLGAPLVTEASTWGEIFNHMNAELIEESKGSIRFQFFFGIGDEKGLIELLKNKQFDAVSLTAIGIGQILHEINILQLPMMFSTYDELDHVRDKVTRKFSDKLEKKGYVFLGWGDYGFVYLFSKEPIKTQTDLQRTQPWVWDIDPIGKAFAIASGRDPILLPIQSVLISLRKGDVQTVYSSPLACIVLQWHTQIKYMTSLPLSAGVGATIIDKGRFDRLSVEHKHLLKEITKKYHKLLVSRVQRENEKAIGVLQEQGIKVVSVPNQEELKWLQVAEQVQNQFTGKLYSKELLDEVRHLVGEYRKIEQ